jgi:hypothetical protein
MYLLTNDRSQWLEDLKALLKSDGWNTIKTSRDLELDQVQLDVSNAVIGTYSLQGNIIDAGCVG